MKIYLQKPGRKSLTKHPESSILIEQMCIRDRYNVKSLVAGKVLTSSFEEGDIVEEGTVLYTCLLYTSRCV